MRPISPRARTGSLIGDDRQTNNRVAGRMSIMAAASDVWEGSSPGPGPLGATRAFSRLLGRFLGDSVRLRRCLLLRCPGNLREARDQLDPAEQAALGGMPDPVVPHLVRAAGENVLQESPDELHCAERHRFPLPLTTDLVPERHPTVFDANQAAIGEGRPVDVPPEVLQHLFGPLDRRFAVDMPLLVPN